MSKSRTPEIPPVADEIFTPEGLGKRLGFTPRYIADNIREGRLRAWKLGSRWFIFYSDVVRWIRTTGEPSQ